MNLANLGPPWPAPRERTNVAVVMVPLPPPVEVCPRLNERPVGTVVDTSEPSRANPTGLRATCAWLGSGVWIGGSKRRTTLTANGSELKVFKDAS